VIADARARRAVENKSRKGRGMAFGMWIGHEFETLTTLHAGGANVPRPIASAGSAMLMEYFGDEWSPAPRLADIEIDAKEAPNLYRQILRNVEIGLSCHLVHGDLSEYNILYWKGEARIIDYPQAVDTLRNGNAYALLQRDIERVTAYFAQYGVGADSHRVTRSLWGRYGK
jgi:RIO kinase 1